MFIQFTLHEVIGHGIISKNDGDDRIIKSKVLLFLHKTIKHEQLLELPVYVCRNMNNDITRIEVNIPIRLIKESIWNQQ